MALSSQLIRNSKYTDLAAANNLTPQEAETLYNSLTGYKAEAGGGENTNNYDRFFQALSSKSLSPIRGLLPENVFNSATDPSLQSLFQKVGFNPNTIQSEAANYAVQERGGSQYAESITGPIGDYIKQNSAQYANVGGLPDTQTPQQIKYQHHR